MSHNSPRQDDLTVALNRRELLGRCGIDCGDGRFQRPSMGAWITYGLGSEYLELAYRMQGEAADAFDISRGPDSIRTLYGRGTQARQLLITRRLIERGVRFVQVWSGAGQPWDDHENLTTHHRQLVAEWDQAIAGFLTDLQQRGLFDQVLVLWGGEFGRTPRCRTAGALGPRS
jgi:Protein of unknown function (DUF1501)